MAKSPRPVFMVRKRNLLVFIIGAFLFMLFALSILITVIQGGFFRSQISRNLSVFEGRVFPINIEVPNNWKAFETPQGDHGDEDVIGIFLPDGHAVPYVILEKRVLKGDMNKVLQWRENKLHLLHTYSDISLDNYSNGKYDGYMRYFTWKKEGNLSFSSVTLFCREFTFLNNETGYSIRLCAEKDQWNEYHDLFLQIINSLSIQP